MGFRPIYKSKIIKLGERGDYPHDFGRNQINTKIGKQQKINKYKTLTIKVKIKKYKNMIKIVLCQN